jgi:putative transposase
MRVNRMQAFRYRLRPTGEQERRMRRFAGACRYAYNRALAEQKARYAAGENKLGFAGLCKQLTSWRADPDTAWLSQAPIHPLQQAMKDLERAYTNFFAGRASFPEFKRKGRSRASFRYPDPAQIKLDPENERIFLPKLGWLRYHNSRQVLGEVRNVTVSERAGHWYVSIQTAREVEAPVHPSASVIGIDVGVKRFATLSDGSFIAPLDSFRRHERRLARAQRALARKQKGSNNYRKARAKVARVHARIADARNDFLHKTSATISQNHAIVCIEDLNVRGMSASAAGTPEKPGRRVRQKSGLNKAILDQGWGEFRRQLEYKLAWRGGRLIAVSPQNTSRTCPECRHIAAENRRTQAEFRCVSCGYQNHADLVGALNVLEAAGLAASACGGTAEVTPPVKQEPAEATHAQRAA